jgi:type I restriction enzyme S subunit
VAESAAQGGLKGRFKPYPAYKDSGVEWLGDIPEHWKESKVKYLGCYINGYPFKPEDWSSDGLPIIRIQNLTNPEASFNRYAGEVNPRCRVRNGDILISWSASLGIFLWNGTEDGWLNQHIFKVSLREDIVDRQFFFWLGDWFIRELQKETHGSTMTHLTNNMFGGFRVELPSFDEQQKIAIFLDRKAEHIDALVAKKERLIELLQEQRTALITRAVTKGLDPSVPMKDSGVEWLGEIPKHWEVKKMKNVCSRVFVGIAEAATDSYVEGGIPMLRSTDIRENRIRTDDIQFIDPVFAARLDTKKLREGDIATVRTGNAGVSAVVPAAFDGGQCFTLVVSRPKGSNDSKYFCYWLNSPCGVEQFQVEGVGTAQVNISVPIVQNIIVCVPPAAEQQKITESLEAELRKLDSLAKRVQSGRNKLLELRTALISAAVTGKIDVRVDVR